MKRTYNKTCTPEGYQRKLNRLVFKELQLQFPSIYEELVLNAKNVINNDNLDPRSKIVTTGLNVVHRKSAYISALEKELKRDKRDWAATIISKE